MNTEHTETLQAVAAILGGTYNEAHPTDYNTIGYIFFDFYRFRVARICDWSMRNSGMIKIQAHPLKEWNASHHGAPSANFTPTRSPRAIAADIKRRVITPGRSWLHKKLKEHQELHTRESNRNAFLMDLFSPYGVTPEQIDDINKGRFRQSIGNMSFPVGMRLPENDQSNVSANISLSMPAFKLVLQIAAEDWKIQQKLKAEYERQQEQNRHARRAAQKQKCA